MIQHVNPPNVPVLIEDPIAPHANLGAISGAPLSMTKRTVRIFRPSKTAMQSGTKQSRSWRLEFDIQSKWENPLMGWTSSADPVQGLDMSFDTMEEAVRFAERQGWNIRVDAPAEKKYVKRLYAENFYYSPGPLRLTRTK
jgi:NADH dehydrogenase (ubiquinone) Fe-S protein 4